MKKMFLMILLSAVGSSAFAASPEVLKAVLSSQQVVSAIPDIERVEVVATYRCPSCYDIVVSGLTPVGESYVKVRTEQSVGGPLKVRILEGSR